MEKKISIIVPTYNSEKYIKKSIKSIIDQNYNNWEIVICDNNSIDKTIKYVQEVTNYDQRVKIIQKNDNGVAEALNNGFNLASGEIFCWLNSDDLFLSEDVFIIANKHIDTKNQFLNGNFLNIDANNKVIKSFYSFLPNYKIKKFFYFNQIFTGSFFFSKELFRSFKGFNEKYKYSFEYEIIIYCLKNFRGKHINKFLSCFRILPNALSSNKKELKEEFNEILKKEKLIYTNNIFLRFISMIFCGNLFKAIINKFFDILKGKTIT